MKRRNIMVLMIALSLILLLGSSYALLRSTQVGTIPYVINVGTLQVTFEEGKTNKLSLENMYPMSDKEGMSQSEELGFTVMNTGNQEARYNVYLEETSTNPEFKNHIRFISNKNNQGYNEPKTMGYDKYIDLEARLNVQMSVSYKVKIWLDYDADNTYMDKTFTAKVIVESNQIDTSNTLYTKINNEITKHPNTTIVEDDITYLSGSNDDVNYNYVWYSGKLWRIVTINQDGSIKLVTETPQTVLSYGATPDFETSFAYQFLNEDFLDTLYNHENIIVTDYLWNNTLSEDYEEKIPETDMIKASVGMLTVYEYYQSYIKSFTNRYLSNMFNQLLLTPSDNNNIWTIANSGSIVAISYSLTGGSFGISPVIVIKPEITISSGDGSITNPYRIKGDKELVNNQKLNERVSGEYVKFDGELFRIVEVEDNKVTKLVTSSYLKDGNEVVKKMFSSTDNNYNSSVNSSSDEYWGYYLNNSWYNKISEKYKKMLVDNTYYLGGYELSDGYKSTICNTQNTLIKKCDKVNSVWIGKVGLLRVGEKFASQSNAEYLATSDFVLISPLNPTYISGIREGWINGFSISEKLPTKITITLSDEVVIVSGKGIEQAPYEISCPSCDNT